MPEDTRQPFGAATFARLGEYASFGIVTTLSGRVALVTGASRGIGRACAMKLGALGARVAVNYNTSAAAADDVVARIKAGGGEATAVQGDVSDFTTAQGVVKNAIAANGGSTSS